MTLPPESQNSASPYALTARTFSNLKHSQFLLEHLMDRRIGRSLLGVVALEVGIVAWGDSRIENDGDHDDSCVWDIVSPETEDFTQGGDFEGDQEGFVEEEVPSGHESKGIVDPFTSKTNETTRDGHHGCHFSYAVID